MQVFQVTSLGSANKPSSDFFLLSTAIQCKLTLAYGIEMSFTVSLLIKKKILCWLVKSWN